jgi:hypothetical protein
MTWNYYTGIANLLDPTNRSYILNQGKKTETTNVLKNAEPMTHIYYSGLLPDALSYLVFGDYSGVALGDPSWTSHLMADSVFQVFRGNWNDDSDWLSLITFNKTTPLYSRRVAWHGDQMSFEYYSKGDLLLADGGEDKYVLDHYWGMSELSHNTIAVENPRSPFSVSSWAGSQARGILKGVRTSDVTFQILTPSYIKSIAQVPWLDMIDVDSTISSVVGSSFGSNQPLSSPISYERAVLYPEKDYFIVIDRMEGAEAWGYRDIFRPSSLSITPTSGSNIGHVNGNLYIDDWPYDWQSLDYKKETSTGVTTNSIRWGTTNPYGKDVELELYTVPSSQVLVTKYVGRIAGYGSGSEVYCPVVSFRTAPSNAVYRATVLLSRYSAEGARTPSVIPVTGTGNALKVASPTYQDYVYTGSGTSTFASFATNANTAYVRTTNKPIEYTLIDGSMLEYLGKPLVVSTVGMNYITMKQDGDNMSFEVDSGSPADIMIYPPDTAGNYHVTMDGKPYAGWAFVNNSTGIKVSVEGGKHEFEIDMLTPSSPIDKSGICLWPLSALLVLSAVSPALLAYFKDKL